MGPADAARTLGITFEEAVKVKNQLLASFPGIKLYSKNAIAFARSRGKPGLQHRLDCVMPTPSRLHRVCGNAYSPKTMASEHEFVRFFRSIL